MTEEREPLDIDAEDLADAAGVDDSSVDDLSGGNDVCTELIDRTNRPWNTRPGPDEDVIKRLRRKERLDDVVRERRMDGP